MFKHTANHRPVHTYRCGLTTLQRKINLTEQTFPCDIGVGGKGVFGERVEMNHVAPGLPGEHFQRLLAAHPRRGGQAGRIETGELTVQRIRGRRTFRRNRSVGVRTFPQLAGLGLAVAHNNHRHGIQRTLLHPVNEQREDVLIGGMAEFLACLSRGEPNNLIDFADIRPMHRAERVSAAQVVNRTDWRGHPELDVLSVHRAILGMASFAAFLGQWIFDIAKIGAKLHR